MMMTRWTGIPPFDTVTAFVLVQVLVQVLRSIFIILHGLLAYTQLWVSCSQFSDFSRSIAPN